MRSDLLKFIGRALQMDQSGRLLELELENLPPDWDPLFYTNDWPRFLVRIRIITLHFTDFVRDNRDDEFDLKAESAVTLYHVLHCHWIAHLANVECLAVSFPVNHVVRECDAVEVITRHPREPLPMLHKIILNILVIPRFFIALQKSTLQNIELKDCALSCRRNRSPDDGFWDGFIEDLGQSDLLQSLQLYSDGGNLRYVVSGEYFSDLKSEVEIADHATTDLLAYNELREMLERKRGS